MFYIVKPSDKLIRGKITGGQCEAIVLIVHWLYMCSNGMDYWTGLLECLASKQHSQTSQLMRSW